jgi:Ca2+-binding EF-hand superfamily protein
MARKYEDLMMPVSSLLDPECEDIKSVKHLRNRVHMLQIAHLKSIQELERCEKMLQTQTDINRELSLEIEQLTTQEITASNALQKRMRDIELLCEERLQRIQRLEAEIRQLKYLRGKADASKSREAVEDEAGSSDDDASDVVSIPESLVLAASELASGEQLIELWVRSASFDRKMVGENASTFVLCDFFDFESQSTSLMIGSHPEYNLSATFKVTVDGFFLRYLASETLTLEVHQAIRGDFQVVGRASIRLASLLQSKGAIKEPDLPIYRVDGIVSGEKKGLMGTLDAILRLSMPISEIWRLHLQSFPQDIKLLSLDTKRIEAKPDEKDNPPCNESAMEDNKTQLNELRVTVFACRGLGSSKSSGTPGRRPSAYVHYQILGYPDIFTNIVPESADPEFDLDCSRQVFVLQVDACLLRFFSKCQLWFTVFDDQIEMERNNHDGGMIGKCGVFMSELVEGNKIMGWRSLLNGSNQPVGEISVLIEWSNPFQILAIGSAQSGRGLNDRTADLHVLNLDQQHSILQAFSSCLNGRVNYRQFLQYTSPPEELELLTAKIKERLEAELDSTRLENKTVENLLVPETDRTGHYTDVLVATQQLAMTMEKLGIILLETELDCLRKYFSAPHQHSAPSILVGTRQLDQIALGYLLMHVNPRMSCRDRLLCHKLRHTVRGFTKQRIAVKSNGNIQSPVQVFERFDVQRGGYVSRAEFRRALSVLGFELQNSDEEYRNMLESRLERPSLPMTNPAALKVQGSVSAAPVDENKPVDDEDELQEMSQSVRSQAKKSLSSKALNEPQLVSNNFHASSAGQSKLMPAKFTSATSTSATDEFQRRKQAFTDRMKAIVSVSSKSLVYEQIEKKQLQQRRQFEGAPQYTRPVDMAAIDERLDRFLHHQAAARKLQKQYRAYKSGTGDSVDILESDLVLSKLLKNWSSRDLKTWTDEVARLIEDQVSDARKSKTISKKQFGFFLSKVPRMALPVGLLKQLMEHFSVKKSGSVPTQAVAYRPLLDFIRLTSTDDVEKEKLRQQPLWKALHSIRVDASHALETFETVGDVQRSGLISFRKFRDAMSRLGVQISPKNMRILMVMFDVSGVEILYHAFLNTISQLPSTQELMRTLTRCCRFGVSALREKVITLANSTDDGTVSKQELHDVLMQLHNDFVVFTSKDAQILSRLASNSAKSQGVVDAERIPLDELFKHLSRFASREEPIAPLEDLNKYPVASLQGLARNCRKFLCGSYSELQAAFERFDWEETGTVSLAEFVSIARQSGFAVFTETQLKTIAKLFGVKVDGRFGINFRQFLDWTTPCALPEVEIIEGKLRCVAQDCAQHLPSKQLTDVLANWRKVFARHAESSPQRTISRSMFRKICRDELRLPLAEEEMRSLLFAYDRELVDEINYTSFVQLNWNETQHHQPQRAAGQASVTFQLDQNEANRDGEKIVDDLAAKLRSRKVTQHEVMTALMNFASKDDTDHIGEGEFILAMRQLGVMLSPEKVRSIFQTLANKHSPQATGKVSNDKLLRALGFAPASPGRREAPQRMAMNDEGRKRLETAVQAAAQYSQPAFQTAFARFQEFCVVHRFGSVPAPKLWQEMNANGFADLLSAKGVGLLAENFIAEHSGTDEATGPSNRVALKGVHALLKRYLGVSGDEASTRQRSTAPEELKSLSDKRRRSDAVHPLRMDNHSNGDRKGAGEALISAIERLVGWCESQGIDYRGEFEQYDREYTGAVSAIEFKQVLLRLGLKQFTDQAEVIIGELVRDFRMPPPQDTVCYTAMLNQATMTGTFHQRLESSLPLSEDLRTRVRQRAKISGKIDQTDPSIYTKLNACFGHFDRDRKGFLSESCLLAGLQALKYDPTKEELRQLLALICVFRHTDTSSDASTSITVSRMEFDSFILDPYGFRVLQQFADRLFERVSSSREPDVPRIALLARSLSENDAPTFSGALTRDVFFSLLGNALGRSVLEAERHSLRHLFDVNRDARIAYKLFLKVMSQWRGTCPAEEAGEGCFSPANDPSRRLSCSAAPEAAPCALHDLLSSLYNQLSSIDFDAQIEILNEYLQDKDEKRRGFLKMRKLVDVFEQIGLSLSADGFKSLEVYFAGSDVGFIAYDELLQELMGVHKGKTVTKTSRK